MHVCSSGKRRNARYIGGEVEYYLAQREKSRAYPSPSLPSLYLRTELALPHQPNMLPPPSSSSSISERAASDSQLLRSLRPNSPSCPTKRPRTQSACASTYFSERNSSATTLFQTASKAESS
eukprot:2446958-Rhodomonas_salina.3